MPEKDAAPFLKQVQYAPIATAITDAYKQVKKEEYKDVLNNNIELPKESAEDKANKDFAKNMLAACPAMGAQYKEIEDFIKKYKHSYTFNVPPPPYMDYENCWSSHPSKQAAYDSLVTHYIQDVFKRRDKAWKRSTCPGNARKINRNG